MSSLDAFNTYCQLNAVRAKFIDEHSQKSAQWLSTLHVFDKETDFHLSTTVGIWQTTKQAARADAARRFLAKPTLKRQQQQQQQPAPPAPAPPATVMHALSLHDVNTLRAVHGFAPLAEVNVIDLNARIAALIAHEVISLK